MRAHLPALPRPAAFAVASAALISVFLASGTPIPLYNTYRVQDGLTNGDLALTTVLYLAVTATSLLVFGRLSDHLGRKPVVIGAVLAALIGCLLLSQVHALPQLVAGRMLQGIACGTASSAAGALVIDLGPRTRARWLAPVVTSNAPPFAIPAGALASGVLVEFAPAPRVLGFDTMLAILAVVVVLLLFVPETTPRRPGAIRSLRPRVLIPGYGRTFFVATGLALIATWSFTGFYQAFGPSLAADYLGTSDAVMIALVFASIVVLAPIGGITTSRVRPDVVVTIGLTVFLIAVAGAITTLHHAAIIPFLIISAIGGIAQGAAAGGAMRGVLTDARSTERAGTLATLYLISYSGGAAPGLVSSQFAETVPLTTIGVGYAAFAVLIGVGAIVLAVLSRRARTR